jgi:hypothetical protein
MIGRREVIVRRGGGVAARGARAAGRAGARSSGPGGARFAEAIGHHHFYCGSQ